MTALLRSLLELCLLRRGPQDLPYSPPAVLGFTLALVALQTGFAMQQGLSGVGLVARVFVTLLLLFGVTHALLLWRKLENRAVQTLLALAGTSVVFSLVMFPLAVALQPYMGTENPPSAMLLPAGLAIFLFIWKLRVDAAIWRQSLDIASLPAYSLTLSLIILEAALLSLLVPTPATVPGAG